MTDREANRFSARAARYARVGANMSGVAARIAGARLFGLTLDRGQNALERGFKRTGSISAGLVLSLTRTSSAPWRRATRR